MKLDKKYIIIISILVVFIIIVILAKVLTKDKFNERLINHLASKDYIKDTGTMYAYDDEEYQYDSCLHSSLNCLGRRYFFDTNSYKLILDEILKTEGVEYNFTPTHNYSDDTTTYYYRIRYKNGLIVLKGDYSEEDFNCKLEYSYGIKVDDKSVYCSPLKEKLDSFVSYSMLLMDDTYIRNRMHDKK